MPLYYLFLSIIAYKTSRFHAKFFKTRALPSALYIVYKSTNFRLSTALFSYFMKGRIIYSCLFFWLFMAGLSNHTFAQTITTGTITPTPICPGGAITVPFSISGTFAASNTFSAQLSNASGTFSANPPVIGTLAGAVAGTINATIPATIANGSGYRIRVVSSNPVRTGSASAQALTVTAPVTPGITTPLTYCVGQPASKLIATPSTNGSLNWYGTNATGSSGSSTAPTPPTSTSGTTIYYVSQTLNGCESPRAEITVTVNPIPAAPTATAPAPYCEGVTAQPLSASGQGLKWYGTNATGGSGSGSATIPGTAASATYYVTQTVNGCESARTGIPVQVKDSPGAPAITAAPTYCQNQPASVLSATPSTGAILNWYGTNSSGGIASTTATTPSTSQAGSVDYYVSQTLAGCESPRAAIAVTVKPTPGEPGISSPIIACQNQSGYTLAATPSTGGSLNWYGTAATGGTATTSPAALTTTTLGSTTYYVSQSVNGCESVRASLTVTVNAVPAAPVATPPAAYCEGVTAQPLSASGQNLRWYGTNATGGSSSGSATVPSTSSTAIGSTLYYVAQTVSGCESARTAITVQVKDTPNAPSTSAIDYCQGENPKSLTATLVSDATVNWYGTNPSGGTASSTAPVPSSNDAGTTIYYVSQTVAGCEGPRASLSIRVKATPSAPGTNSISFCNRSQTQPLTANGSGLKWYDVTDNLLNGGAPTPSSDAVGSQVFKVSQTIESCEGPKATVTVTIKPLPDKPGVAPLTFCQSQQDQPPQNLSPLSASGQGLKWYTTDNKLLSSAPIPVVDRTGTQTYQVSQTVNDCEGEKASLQVTILTPSAPVTSKSLITYCINDKAVPLEATGETGSQLRWVDPYGNVTANAPTPSTLNTNVQLQGDPFYVYQIASYGCYSARTMIRVVVNTTPTLSLFAPTTTVNLGLRVPLQLKFTGSGPYSYSLTGGYSGTVRTDTTISVLPRGNTSYQVTSVVNGCGTGLPGNTATISVRVPTVSTSNLSTTTLCAGTSLSVPFTTTGEFNPGNAFRIEMVSVADTTKKYAASTSANGSPITSSLPTTVPGGQYYIRVKADNPEIGITGSNSPTLLTIRSLPTATLTGTQNIYEGIPANLTLTFGGDGPWNVIYADSLRSYPLTAPTSPYVVEARPARTTTYRLTSVSNSCGTGVLAGTAVVSVVPLLGIDDNSLDPLVKAYPVPTETILILELNLPLTHDPAVVTLTDLSGKPILQQTTRNQRNELNLVSHPSGLYLMRIQVGDRQTVRKIMKQ